MSRVLLVVFVLMASPLVAFAAVPQAFLVQNSGWMEPFYTDRDGQLIALVGKIIAAVADAGESVTVSTFNQAVPGNDSPSVIHAGPSGPTLTAALARIDVARRSEYALADTDFQEAVTKTVLGPLKAKPGIIWIVTNNKNSPHNSRETAQRNQEFYELLHHEPSIVRTVVFPVSMPVTGRIYRANGVMIYGLAYGADADARLVHLAARVRDLLGEAPARLKPLTHESVALIPVEVRNAPSTRVSMGRDGRTVVLDVDVSQRQPIVEISARVENQFYPYLIADAEVSARFGGRGWAKELEVTPKRLTGLAPAAAKEVTVALPIPLAQIPSVWSPAALGSAGKQYIIRGAIDVSLSDQRLQISPAFRARLADIFPGDPISEMFTPSQTVRSSSVTVPVLIRVTYPILPLVVVGAGGLVLATAAGAGLLMAAREKRFDVVIDGAARHMALKPFRSTTVRSPTGEVIGTLKRGLGRPTVSDVTKGHSITVKA